MRWILIASLLTLPLANEAAARVRHVPDEEPTIQAALEAARSGDMILVAPGTYFEHDLVMKDGVALIGQYHPDTPVVIDTAGEGRGILCSGVGTGTRIENLVILNGTRGGGGGGAIYCDDADPRIEKCTFRDNSALRGGAVALINSSPHIRHCRFESNTALHVGGGAMAGVGSEPYFYACEFSGNRSNYFGGGMHCRDGADPLVEQCDFVGNEAGEYGGAVSVVTAATPTLLACDLSANRAWGEGGGGVWIAETSDCELSECVLDDNGEFGVKLRDGSLLAEYCDFSAHEIALSVGAEAVDCVVLRCGFFGNADYAIRSDASFPIRAEYNYWGHASGPLHASNLPGTGDAVSDDVDYAPWLHQWVVPADMVGLSGVVSGSDTGTPLAGGRIAVYPMGTVEPATTDALGRWQLKIPPGTGYLLEVSRHDYATVLEHDLVLAPGEVREFDHVLDPANDIYEDYRIVDFDEIPVPEGDLKVTEGGILHAWFKVEGQLADGTWQPVPNAWILAQDQTGDYYGARANIVKYQFLTQPAHFEIPGVFGIRIPADRIWGGQLHTSETFTIERVNGEILSADHDKTFRVRVVPYEYSTEWGYRLWAHIGGGATAGIATGVLAVGGGTGSSVIIDFAGLANNSYWRRFRVRHQADIYVFGAGGLGPPKLLSTGSGTKDIGIGIGIEGGVTLPYAHEYEFDMNELEGLEALTAFYLIVEPVISLGPQETQIVTTALSWFVQLLIQNSSDFGVARYADEVGLDIWGGATAQASVAIGIGDSKKLKIGAEGSLGVDIHVGGALRYEVPDTTITTKLYVNGGVEGSLGPQFLGMEDRPEVRFVSPLNWLGLIPAGTINAGFVFSTEWKHLTEWQGVAMDASMRSDVHWFNTYNLPGVQQEYTYGITIDSQNMLNLLHDVTTLPATVANVGSQPDSTSVGSTSFLTDFTNFLGAVYDEQVSNGEAVVGYNWKVDDINEFSLGLDLEIPLPIVPPIVLKIGAGVEAGEKDEHKLGSGYYYQGLPFLQNEMPSPPTNTANFFGVVGELWGYVISGNILQELVDIVLQQILDTFFWWLKDGREVFLLSPGGSTLDISSTAVPADVDSTHCRHWEWNEGRLYKNATPEKEALFKAYVDRLRAVRQEIVGMHYGIGGFHSLRPLGLELLEPAELTLRYGDEEVAELDERTLSVYREDEDGRWHLMPSTNVADSNLVRTTIDTFRTYTLAPRMPSGEYGLTPVPATLPADGLAEAVLTSEPLLNNDGTPIAEGTLFTVAAGTGEILAADADPDHEGIQVAVAGQALGFGYRAGEVSGPVDISAESVNGYAKCTVDLPLHDAGLPAPPVIATLRPAWRGFAVTWEAPEDPDLAGYLVWYDADGPGAPYDGQATVWGADSPVSVGMVDSLFVDELAAETTYYVALTAVDIEGNQSDFSEEFAVIVGVEGEAVPLVLALDQNRPNPFNPLTRIDFSLPRRGPVDLKVYDVRGQLVRTLVVGELPGGRHSAFWRGEDNSGRRVASGVYLYELRTEEGARTRKMVVVK